MDFLLLPDDFGGAAVRAALFAGLSDTGFHSIARNVALELGNYGGMCAFPYLGTLVAVRRKRETAPQDRAAHLMPVMDREVGAHGTTNRS